MYCMDLARKREREREELEMCKIFSAYWYKIQMTELIVLDMLVLILISTINWLVHSCYHILVNILRKKIYK
jgi:hypothetical protein